MIPLLPVAIGSLALISYSVTRKRGAKGMTAERQIIFDNAIRSLKDPVKLRTLASAFEGTGLKQHAILLRKRAALRELPAEVKAKRDLIYRAALKSTDPIAINKLAEAYAKEGATNAAETLRKYASGLTEESVIDNTVAVNEPMAELPPEIPAQPEEPLPAEIPVPVETEIPIPAANSPIAPDPDPEPAFAPEPDSQSPNDETPIDPNGSN